MRLAEVVEVANKNEADLALSGLDESKSTAGNSNRGDILEATS